MKKLWLGSSWKMTKTSGDVTLFCQQIQPTLHALTDSIQSFLIPPFPYVAQMHEQLSNASTKFGVQNVCWAESGAFTGEISTAMAVDLGASIAEIGHSERRHYFNETDKTVNLKVRAALTQGLQPLICVGDTHDEKQWGVSIESIVRQVKIALHSVDTTQLDKVIIAYEPVWAIGINGVPATAKEAELGLYSIKQALNSLFGEQSASKVVLLYGGSVNHTNAAELLTQPSIDGLFVGRAAWDAKGYAKLLEIASHYLSSDQHACH
ncbi:triosephosphate isomerase (plasmid) [Vibrio sp. qd031]|uniref:triose-phosphate isomerase n=1 Tax=Vibrio sp. qd031 TaxID=1603038 RepID=UPI000A11D967|nr:triose-phosphate isomerase [Vibrio sp. qd031]ORT52419.1 triosephosphate isomerase [Vibrio sp. qd031]